MYSYFHRTSLDESFFEDKLRPHLPSRIIDAHAHFNLPKHVANVTPESISADWALECGLLMTYEEASYYTSLLFPGISMDFVALPWPLRDADTEGNNLYIASLIRDFSLRGLYTVRPEYPEWQVEKDYIAGGYCGFKPYPYMASAVKGADVRIFDFMPHVQFELAERLQAPVLMHLPRAGRLPDPDNVAEIRIILDRYPHVKIVLAHFGRCFQPEYFSRGMELLGEDIHRLWFDCSAVVNPHVYELAFRHVNPDRILYGTDLPIFLWHGRQEWDSKGYHNLCREDFTWNRHLHPSDEEGYTFYLYEQLHSILSVLRGDERILKGFFRGNAEAVYLH